MKAVEMRELETEELHGRISELKEELFNLRFQAATGQLDNHRRMRVVRQEVARIRTVLRERDFAAALAAGTPVRPAAETAPVTTPEQREPVSEASGAPPAEPKAEPKAEPADRSAEAAAEDSQDE